MRRHSRIRVHETEVVPAAACRLAAAAPARPSGVVGSYMTPLNGALWQEQGQQLIRMSAPVPRLLPDGRIVFE